MFYFPLRVYDGKPVVFEELTYLFVRAVRGCNILSSRCVNYRDAGLRRKKAHQRKRVQDIGVLDERRVSRILTNKTKRVYCT